MEVILFFKNRKLFAAVENGERAAVEALLEKGANINAAERATGRRPLHKAVLQDHFVIAELLVSHGADLNAPDALGQTPLHIAAMTGSREITKMLLTNGADVNATAGVGVTPLRLADGKGNSNIVELLVDHGAQF